MDADKGSPNCGRDADSMNVLEYAKCGMAIIPLQPKSKSPIMRWKHFQTAAPSIEQVEEWAARFRFANWAVIPGPASGDLVVVDFDDFAGYERWRNDWPDIAQAAPTVATKRGRHVYLMTQAVEVSGGMADYCGEVKGCGTIALLPPSVHPSGHRYQWISGDPRRFVPDVSSLAAIGLRIERPE